MKKILYSVLLTTLIISSAVGFSASSNVSEKEPVGVQHLTQETDVLYSARTNVETEPFSVEDAQAVLGFELNDTVTFSMQELESVLGFMPVNIEAEFGLIEDNVKAKIISVKAVELENNTYLEDIVIEYVPLVDYSSQNSMDTATVSSASGTVYLSAHHSYYNSNGILGMIEASASFDWNKDDGTVTMYNAQYSIPKNAKTIFNNDYIRNVTTWSYYSDPFLWISYSKGIEIGYTFGEGVGGDRKIDLRCYSDGDYSGDKDIKKIYK